MPPIAMDDIPQLDDIATSRVEVRDGFATPSAAPGNGIEWDEEAIAKLRVATPVVIGG